MPVIDRIALHFVNGPLPAPFSPAWVPGPPRRSTLFYLAQFVTDDGIEGWSAFSAGGRERAGIGDAVANLFLGADPTDIGRVRECIHIMGVLGVRNGWLEPAFWDIKGKLAGKPVYELLGGKAVPVTLYASSGEVKDPAARIDEAWARYEEGFRTLKIRVHDFDEAVDIRQVQETARAMEGRMKIAVDCNQAFRLTQNAPGPVWDLARAKRFADACADVGVAWIEEPLFMEWFDDMAALTAYSARVPVSGGELHTAGLPELRHMIEKRCYRIFQPDAMWTGGIAETMEVAALCRQHGLGFTPHTWSNGLGFAVNLQILLGSGFANECPFEYPLSPPGWTVEARDVVLARPWTHERGVLTPPTAPGLGFDIDGEALARHGKCFFRADRKSRHWMPEALKD
ncbi:MAG: mandelate racemase/muconate lactonizing enzyme family protein [Betaproteobacteria bacterium]|nr:mandelate racemase/muconate lactonizing enzyme family protein [Betaproteobacteria bacterium]